MGSVSKHRGHRRTKKRRSPKEKEFKVRRKGLIEEPPTDTTVTVRGRTMSVGEFLEEQDSRGIAEQTGGEFAEATGQRGRRPLITRQGYYDKQARAFSEVKLMNKVQVYQKQAPEEAYANVREAIVHFLQTGEEVGADKIAEALARHTKTYQRTDKVQAASALSQLYSSELGTTYLRRVDDPNRPSGFLYHLTSAALDMPRRKLMELTKKKVRSLRRQAAPGEGAAQTVGVPDKPTKRAQKKKQARKKTRHTRLSGHPRWQGASIALEDNDLNVNVSGRIEVVVRLQLGE